MAISKRLRYEILRRDNHACRYCGASAPDAELTVDHVIPVALGGTDDPSNLVTACVPCNTGKSASSPDAPIVDDVAADALRWAAAMQQAAEMAGMARRDQLEAEDRIHEAWDAWRYGSKSHPLSLPLPADWRQSVDQFLKAGLTVELLTECIDIAGSAARIPPDHAWRYMCGIAWKKVAEIREIASTLIEANDGESGE